MHVWARILYGPLYSEVAPFLYLAINSSVFCLDPSNLAPWSQRVIVPPHLASHVLLNNAVLNRAIDVRSASLLYITEHVERDKTKLETLGSISNQTILTSRKCIQNFLFGRWTARDVFRLVENVSREIQWWTAKNDVFRQHSIATGQPGRFDLWGYIWGKICGALSTKCSISGLQTASWAAQRKEKETSQAQKQVNGRIAHHGQAGVGKDTCCPNFCTAIVSQSIG